VLKADCHFKVISIPQDIIIDGLADARDGEVFLNGEVWKPEGRLDYLAELVDDYLFQIETVADLVLQLLKVLVSIDSIVNGGVRGGQEVVATEVSIEKAIE
jgi:hypothetical protein